MNKKSSTKDFFLHFGDIISFYATVISLIVLLFNVINYAYPAVTGYNSTPSISLQVAVLIVAFPLFLLFSWLLRKSYIADPNLLDLLVRRWFLYFTLFIAGAVTAGDMITVIYKFLDGQELTTGFVLKFFTVLVISGGVFLYYLREIRNIIGVGERNIWRIFSIAIIFGSIILGFTVMGSPATQRAKRYDSQRVSDLQNIQSQVVTYWQQKEKLPSTLSELNNPLLGYIVPVDPKTNEAYEYKTTGNLSFQMCANFQREGSELNIYYLPSTPMPVDIATQPKGYENWQHGSGRTCFDRTIDPQIFPPYSTLKK